VTISVTQGANCAWQASVGNNSSFISITQGGGGGTGGGSVTFSVDANSGGARQGTLTVAGQTVTVSQAAASGPGPGPGPGCAFSLGGDTNKSFPASGGTGTVTLTVTQGTNCSWSASLGANSSFISFTSGTSGTGNGSFSFSVSANQGASTRNGSINVIGQTVNVNQAGAASNACTSLSFGSQTRNIGAAGNSSLSETLTASPAGCPWTAASTDTSWLTITSGASGNGSGSVGFAVAANQGGQRTANINASSGGTVLATLPVTEAAGVACSYTGLDTSTRNVGAAGNNNFTLTVTTSCGWAVSSNVPWITFPVASGTGSGVTNITWAVAVNATGATRSGTITFNGTGFSATITVNQDK